MSEHEKLLDEALITQFREVDTGEVNGQKKKESVETLQIMYNLKMAQVKANQDAEFRESEMALKEREMALKEAEQKAKELQAKNELVVKEREVEVKELQAEVEHECKAKELAIKERELAIRKSESLMKKIEIFGSIGLAGLGTALYQRNVNKIYDFETKTIKTVTAQRALRYAQNFEKLAVTGARMVFSRGR